MVVSLLYLVSVLADSRVGSAEGGFPSTSTDVDIVCGCSWSWPWCAQWGALFYQVGLAIFLRLGRHQFFLEKSWMGSIPLSQLELGELKT